MVNKIAMHLFLDQSEFTLPCSFKNYNDLIAEADFYCLEEMTNWLKIESEKNSARFTFATLHEYRTYFLYISGNTLLLYNIYMNEEERNSFLSDHMKPAQINSLKLRLQRDGFRCYSSEEYVSNSENSSNHNVILIEKFSRV